MTNRVAILLDPVDRMVAAKAFAAGRLLVMATSYNVALDTTWSLPIADIEPVLLSSLQDTQFNRFCAAPWPDDGMNRGRALCCLYSTLLC